MTLKQLFSTITTYFIVYILSSGRTWGTGDWATKFRPEIPTSAMTAIVSRQMMIIIDQHVAGHRLRFSFEMLSISIFQHLFHIAHLKVEDGGETVALKDVMLNEWFEPAGNV